MKRVLVHICCGPCSIYPIKAVLKEEAEVTGFFFNPNIQPLGEYQRREDAVRKLSSLMGLDVIFSERHAEAFIRDDRGTHLRELDKGDRCRHCYSTRLRATAKAASEHGFDAFSTSLLYSRYQEHELIVDIAKRYGEEFGVPLLYRDFRTGWREGIDESKEMGLYRQKYCGCVYSWMERYKIEPRAGGTKSSKGLNAKGS